MLYPSPDDLCLSISRVTITHDHRGLAIVPEMGVRFSISDADGTKEFTLQRGAAEDALSEVLRKVRTGEPFTHVIVLTP